MLISIQPKWCEKIANGEKTVEVRKTRPKLKTPFKCYIYCTKPRFPHEDHITLFDKQRCFYAGGKVIGEFMCREVECFTTDYRADKDQTQRISRQSCVDMVSLTEYEYNAACLFGWHLSDLQIYDTLKELSEFTPSCRYGEDGECLKSKEVLCLYQKHDFNPDGSVNLVSCSRRAKRPPQSWCYVEELPGGDG